MGIGETERNSRTSPEPVKWSYLIEDLLQLLFRGASSHLRSSRSLAVSSYQAFFFSAIPMTYHLITAPVGLLNAGIDLGAKRLFHRSRAPHRKYSTKFRRIRAVQENEGPRRLVDLIRIIP
ncbi:hypothetical protein J5N97_022248 [Dioscorea zingiberensis]|uniref:Uncharacterized protein n=1 Tax=Dioscorea zingiberensis TaxID=325984 RepID=A0A9D5CA69_9LILI|nr:hypothetical protein J5N97_022248 [Dioscorea zingiberensis]